MLACSHAAKETALITIEALGWTSAEASHLPGSARRLLASIERSICGGNSRPYALQAGFVHILQGNHHSSGMTQDMWKRARVQGCTLHCIECPHRGQKPVVSCLLADDLMQLGCMQSAG